MLSLAGKAALITNDHDPRISLPRLRHVDDGTNVYWQIPFLSPQFDHDNNDNTLKNLDNSISCLVLGL
jgi:hypothetical protein